MDAPLCLLSIHAHPDDEASKGASTVAKYHAEGVHTVLVCCTGGEEGDILNPAMDRDEVRDNLGQVRMDELAAAAEVIGYETVHMLGYRDSGMAESDSNGHPECFAMAPLDEAVDRLVAIIRAERPQVVVTYPDDQGTYQHPDHLRVHDITHPAVDAAADAGHRPDLGEPWQVAKVYYSSWSRARLEARHQAFLDLGLESPYDDRWFSRPDQDDSITTKVPVEGFTDARRNGLLAHATQIDPESTFWFGLPPEVDRTLYTVDDYRLAFSTGAGTTTSDGEIETDLFAGIRSEAAAP
ncbi:MAG: mycothiol S-conjugate amidase [Acidimicrobiales bacterium]|nr:MAG: mycothiol S-conjugate amidase [Acidimicrobiales bacterium]